MINMLTILWNIIQPLCWNMKQCITYIICVMSTLDTYTEYKFPPSKTTMKKILINDNNNEFM